jgi:hypothetical protein
LLAQFIGRDPLRFSGNLNVGRMRRLVAAQHNRCAGHPLAADETHVDLCFVGLNGDDRGDAGFHETDRFDPAVGALDVSFDGQCHWLQVRLQ